MGNEKSKVSSFRTVTEAMKRAKQLEWETGKFQYIVYDVVSGSYGIQENRPIDAVCWDSWGHMLRPESDF